jgi:predicted ATP-grasp superfamily ATP-dependent carboligase
MSRALLRRLGWTGVAMIEYRYDPTTESWRFLEINGRFWGSLPLAIDAGIPFAAGLVAAIGEHRPVPAYRSDYPRRHCMFWVPETKRLMRILFWPGKIGDPYFKIRRLAEVAAYLRYPLGASTGFYVFSWNDPGPFLRDSATALGKFHRALCRR